MEIKEAIIRIEEIRKIVPLFIINDIIEIATTTISVQQILPGLPDVVLTSVTGDGAQWGKAHVCSKCGESNAVI